MVNLPMGGGEAWNVAMENFHPCCLEHVGEMIKPAYHRRVTHQSRGIPGKLFIEKILIPKKNLRLNLFAFFDLRRIFDIKRNFFVGFIFGFLFFHRLKIGDDFLINCSSNRTSHNFILNNIIYQLNSRN